MAFKMKGFHMPGIAGVKAEVDKINKLSGKTQKVMKVKPKDEFSTIKSRKKIYDSRVVAPGADQKDVDSEKDYEESKETPLPMKGFPKKKEYEDDKRNPEGNTELSESDGRTVNEFNADVAEGLKELKAGGASPKEIKDYLAYQTKRKQEIHGLG